MLAEASLLVALSVQVSSGAEACLRAPQLARSVEKRLKRRVFVEPARASLRFVVSFERRGSEIEARIEVSDLDGRARGSRSLVTSSHCSALDDSLALSVALLVDQPPEPEPEPAPEAAHAGPAAALPAVMPAQKAKPKPTPITIPADVRAPREPWHARIGVVATGVWGALPDIAPGVSLYLKLVPQRFYPIILQGDIFAPASVARDSGSGARFRLFRAGLSLCPPLVEGAERTLSLCGGQKVGWLEADGYGFDHDASQGRLTFALTLGVEGTLRLYGPVSVRGYLGADVPVVRDQFASGGRQATKLFRASPVAGGAEFGVEAALW